MATKTLRKPKQLMPKSQQETATAQLIQELRKRNPAAWVEAYRPDLEVSGGRKPLFGILNDFHPEVVVMKGVQIGLTEGILINRAIHFMEVYGFDVLYVFPTQQTAREFIAGRFNRILERSNHFKDFFTEVDNVHHKRAGHRNFYCRGSNSEAQLISVPVEVLIVDEFDRIDLDNFGLARDRITGKKENYQILVSTPTIPGIGIDEKFKQTDQRFFVLECPNCKERKPLTMRSLKWYGENYEGASFQCSSCEMPWSNSQRLQLISKGEWVATAPHNPAHGYHLNQLYSPVRDAPYFIQRFVESRYNETRKQIFHNSVLGEAYAPEGSCITEDMILYAQGKEKYDQKSTSARTAMGVDVGGMQHFEIAEFDNDGNKKVIRVGMVNLIDDLYKLIDQYNVACCVIDGNPERQKAREFQIEINRRKWGCVWLCFYPELKEELRWNNTLWTVDANRTETLDGLVAQFQQKKVSLPMDISNDYRTQLRSIVRTNELDKRTGNMVGKWRETGPDHFAHASNYCNIAGRRVQGLMEQVKVSII